MKPLSWAREVAKPWRSEEMTTSSLATKLEEAWPVGGFDDPGFRFWFFNTLARDAERSWGNPSIRQHATERVYKPRQLLSVDDYRDVLNACREDIAKFDAKGRAYLRAAIEAGFVQLRFEFTEFDGD